MSSNYCHLHELVIGNWVNWAISSYNTFIKGNKMLKTLYGPCSNWWHCCDEPINIWILKQCQPIKARDNESMKAMNKGKDMWYCCLPKEMKSFWAQQRWCGTFEGFHLPSKWVCLYSPIFMHLALAFWPYVYKIKYKYIQI